MRRVRAGLVAVIAACTTPQRPMVLEVPATAQLHDWRSGATSAFAVADRYRGKVVVLDLWASWCDECKRTIPAVSRLAATFANAGLVVVGVNVGERPEDVPVIARELGIDYQLALDPDTSFSDRIGAGLPELIVIDRRGAIAHRARRVDPPTLDTIRRLLRE